MGSEEKNTVECLNKIELTCTSIQDLLQQHEIMSDPFYDDEVRPILDELATELKCDFIPKRKRLEQERRELSEKIKELGGHY